MSSGLYNRGAYLIAANILDWGGPTDIRVLLVTAAYVPDRTENTVSQLVANELSAGGGSNYVRMATAGRTVTENDGSNQVELNASDITWVALGVAAGTPAYAIVYYEGGGTDATRELICYLELVSVPPPVPPPNGGDYTVAWDPVGLMALATTP